MTIEILFKPHMENSCHDVIVLVLYQKNKHWTFWGNLCDIGNPNISLSPFALCFFSVTFPGETPSTLEAVAKRRLASDRSLFTACGNNLCLNYTDLPLKHCKTSLFISKHSQPACCGDFLGDFMLTALAICHFSSIMCQTSLMCNRILAQFQKNVWFCSI